ncbi:probable G-protein coupled receptor CG31760 [Ischnura elegans]|uniref:probable G-protein coupled receptor CG31760 n=1 Tax=Ischnura elegans TaxID=197161 RepID=UPI001ED888D9|nr:probable G-protein coupled receptor CG31760 [Ischnura elegans]
MKSRISAYLQNATTASDYGKLGDFLNTYLYGKTSEREMLSVLLHKLIDKDESVLNVRAIAFDPKSALVVDSLCWHAEVVSGRRFISRLEGPALERRQGPEPWFRPAVSSTGVPMPMRATHTQRQSWWSLPYYSCAMEKWLISYGVDIPPAEKSLFIPPASRVRAFLGVDFDLSEFDVNQCDGAIDSKHKLQITAFSGTHKCNDRTSVCEFQSGLRWSRGAYRCHCKPGYYSIQPKVPFNASQVEVKRGHSKENENLLLEDQLQCHSCAEGCKVCNDSAPCLATYSWTFRMAE